MLIIVTIKHHPMREICTCITDPKDPYSSTKIVETFPACGYNEEVVFASKLSLKKIRAAWRKKEDLHVMIQTVAPLNEYTGHRDLDVDI